MRNKRQTLVKKWGLTNAPIEVSPSRGLKKKT